MNIILAGGTDRQQQLVNDALANCSFPLDGVIADVTVTWGTPPSSDTSHPYMVTTQLTDKSYTITIEPWADDPTYPENQGLPDPPANIDQFYRESFVHEIAHVISFMTFTRFVASTAQMCSLFWTAQIGAPGGKRQGNSSDFNPGVDWGLRIMEAVAEVFKCSFCTTSRIFENRTLWHLDPANFSTYLTLITRQDNVHDVTYEVFDSNRLGDSSGDFDFTAIDPLILDGSPVSCSATFTADFFFQSVQAISPTTPTVVAADWNGTASWIDLHTHKELHSGVANAKTEIVTSTSPVDVHFLDTQGIGLDSHGLVIPGIDFVLFAETSSPHTNQASLSFTVDFVVEVTGTGKYIQLQYKIGFDALTEHRYESLVFFTNTSPDGHIFNETIVINSDSTVFGGWVAWSDTGTASFGIPWEGFVPQGNYPFVTRLGSIDVSRVLRGALGLDSRLTGRMPAVGPTRFIGDSNPPHIVLQAGDLQQQSQRRRDLAGSNGLRGALLP